VAVGELTYNPFLPEMIADPYPTYRRLRETDPVHYSDVVRAWVLTRYADVHAVFSDARFSADRSKARKYKGPPRSGGAFLADPPHHTRFRALVTKALTPKVIESMRARVQEVVDELLGRMAANSQADVIDEFAYVLPMTVISEIIGAPSSDHDRFQRWGRDFAGAQDHLYSGRSTTTAGGEMVAYFVELIPKRPDGLVSALLDVSDGDDKLSVPEVIEALVGLLFAGHETTVNLIGNGLLSLLREPDQFARVRDESVERACVEELLRYESPGQIIARSAAADMEWDGRTFRRGDAVVNLIGAANRDPAQFDDPEALDVARSPNQHIAFGHGAHFCLGAQLSRLEGRIAIPALVRRFPNMRLVQEHVDWRPTVVLRGLNSLVVSLR
jgi:pimeloyl-[acyl-carrier protein] synthase